MDKPTLRRIGLAALSGITEAQIRADPARAMLIAQSAMRGALAAARSSKPTIHTTKGVGA